MKKIYKLKSLAVVALAFMANVAFGQNLKVTYEGTPVTDGQVIDLPYEVEDYSYPEFDLYVYHYEWNPHLMASVESGSENLTVTVTSVDDTEGFQICWPMNCNFVQPNSSVVVSGTIDTTPVDLQIDKVIEIYEAGVLPTAGGKVKVKFECGSETMEITINALLEEKGAGVGENLAETDGKLTYYTLDGIQVENPTKGMYVVRNGGKSKLIYKK